MKILSRLFRKAARKPFGEMSDRELGRHARTVFSVLADTCDQQGIKRLADTGAALFLIDRAFHADAGSLTIAVGSANIRGAEIGDWTVTVRRSDVDPERDLIAEADVVLAGTLLPGQTEAAIACFDRLTVFHTTAREQAA